MIPLLIEQIKESVGGRMIAGRAAGTITGVSIDSRTVEPGQVFFAIRGENFDGHEYAVSAAKKGAACIVAEQPITLPEKCNVPVICVDSTIAALGRLATWYRLQLSARVIAITGSVGKTTTRHLLYQVLSRFYKCRQAQKSFNNNIGVPLTIFSAVTDDQILILELGSNHPGEISVLTGIAQPDSAIITLIGQAHLESFGTVEAVLREKASIAEGVKQGGTLYINGDQPALVDYIKEKYTARVITFGTRAECDVIGTNLHTQGNCGSLTIESQHIKAPIAGRANLMNLLTAWSVCRDFNVSLSDFAAAAESLQPIAMRLQVQTIGPLTVLNDCYNANPVSMANALSCLHSMDNHDGKRKIFIAGCMAELGSQSRQLHQELGARAVSEKVQILLAAGPYAGDILTGAAQAGLPPGRMAAFENTEQLCDNLHKWIEPDDIILVKGSRLAGLERAIARLQELFEKQ